MGALAKAIWRNQNLRPVGDAISGYLQRQQYNRDLQQLAQYQKDYEAGLAQAIQPRTQTVTNNVETPIMRQENTDNKPFKTGLGTLPGAGISPLAKLTNKQFQPELVNSGTQILPVETTEEVAPTAQEQRRAVNDQIAKYAGNVFALEGLSPERKQTALSIAQMKAQGYMPQESQYKTLSAGGKLLSISPDGSVTEVGNNPKQNAPTDQWERVGEMVRSKDRHKIVRYRNILTNDVRDEDLGQSYEKPDHSGEGSGSGSGKGANGNSTETLNLKDLIGKIKTNVVKIGYLDKQGADTPEAKTEKINTESEIQGYTDALIETVDSSYPGFQALINVAWQKPKKDRASYIQNLQIPDEAKKYMKFYFESRDRQ